MPDDRRERWQRLKALLAQALELPAERRAPWLRQACAGDEALIAEALALLAHQGGEDTGSLQQAPALAALQARQAAARAGLAGQRVGDWTLVEPLGEGGMGSVWRARRTQARFEQPAAIKLIRGVATDTVLERLRLEQRALASLSHPHIAHFIDGGETPGGEPYLVMELVQGEPIDRWCSRQGCDMRARVALLCQLADAVAHAHERLLVHRDIKPSNVLVTPQGQVKLLDFGVAKLLAADAADVSAAPAAPLTQAADRVLTPHYASPEQVQGQSITVAVDVYGLGATAYHLLTGELPFEECRGQPYALMQAIVERAPRRTIDGDLGTVVVKAMAKRPGDRYATVRDLARDLDATLRGYAVAARPPTWHYLARRFIARHRIASAATGVAALSLLAGLGAALWQAERATDQRNLARQQEQRALQALASAEQARQRADEALALAERERSAAQAAAAAAQRAQQLEQAQRLLAARRHGEVRALAHRVVSEYADDLLGTYGTADTRLKIINDSVSFLDRLRADAGPDPALLAELSRGYRKLAFALGGEASLRDFERADRHLAMARQLRDRAVQLRGQPQDDDRAEIALMDAVAGEMARKRYRFAEARRHLDAARAGFAAASAWRSDDPWDRMGPARAALDTALALAEPGASRASTQAALRLLDDAEAAIAQAPAPDAAAPGRRRQAMAIAQFHASQVHSVRALLLRQSGQLAEALEQYNQAERLAAELAGRDPNNALYLQQWAGVLGARKTLRLSAGQESGGFADGTRRAELASQALARDPGNAQAMLDELSAWSAQCTDYLRLEKPPEWSQQACRQSLDSARAMLALRQTDPYAGAAHQAQVMGGLWAVQAAAARSPGAEREAAIEDALRLQRQGLQGLSALTPAVRDDPLRTAYLVNVRIALGHGLELAGRHAEATQVHRDSLGLVAEIRALGIEEVYTPALLLFTHRRMALNHRAECTQAPPTSPRREAACAEARQAARAYLALAEAQRSSGRLSALFAGYLPQMQALADA